MKHIRSLILALALSAGLAPAFAQAPAPVPALPDTERRQSYVISGTTCACNVNFQLYQDSTDVANWLKVYINGVEIPQSGNWNITSPSGSIGNLARPITDGVLTFTTARTGTVQIVGAQRPRRLSEFSENRGVAARDLNQALNGIEAQLREMWDRQFRTVQAPPGETLNTLPPLASRTSMGACFDSGGNLAPCVAASGSFIAGSGIGFTGTNPTTIAYTGATYSAGTGIQFTGSNPTVISATPSTNQPLLATRTAAAALDLSAYSVVRTVGYATAGDGGGATFKKVVVPFIDSFVNGIAIQTTGSGCSNATYYTWNFTGGTGAGYTALITTAGGILTGVSGTGPSIGVGNGYTVNDVLTPNGTAQTPGGSSITCTVLPTVRVTSVTTPVCSFSDSAGNKWQMVLDGGASLDVRQCGAKVDCPPLNSGGCTIGSATDDFNAIQAAMNFGARPLGLIVGNGGLNGTEVQSPPGWSYVSSPLVVPQGVKWRGRGQWSTGIQFGTGASVTANLITVCDSQSQLACFGTMIEGMYIQGNGTANVGTALIFSNNVQQSDFLRNVVLFGANRGCVKLTNGYGGAAYVGMVDIEAGASAANPCISVSYGAATVKMIGMVVEVPGSVNQAAISITGGHTNLQSFHTEGYQTGVFLNLAAGAGIGQLMSLTGGAGCTDLVVRQTGSAASQHVIGRAYRGGCTNALNNAGALTAADIVADTVF